MVKLAYLKFSANSDAASSAARSKASERVKPVTTTTLRALEAWEGALVGAVAGSISAAATTPLDVLKTRMMTGQAFGASSVLTAAKLIVAKEGVGALYRGIVPRVALIGPGCAVFFMVYELVHKTYH